MTAASKKHLCKKQEEVPSKSEEQVTTTEQNTKQTVNDINVAEWEKEFNRGYCNSYPGDSGLGGNDPQEPEDDWECYPEDVRKFIRSLLASQRHQLKEQVLEAVSQFDIPAVGLIQVIERNKLKSELKKRIEAVFEGKNDAT